MTALQFNDDYFYTGDKILIRAVLPQAELVSVQMTLDTGASVSTLHHSLLAALGLADVTSGRHGTLLVANGESAPCWLHQVEIELLGKRIRIDAAFCPSWDLRNLLGMSGFMNQLVFAVDHANHSLHISWQD